MPSNGLVADLRDLTAANRFYQCNHERPSNDLSQQRKWGYSKLANVKLPCIITSHGDLLLA